MQSTSNDYKIDSKKTLRNPSYIKVSMSIINPTSQQNANISSPSEVYFSRTNDIKSSIPVTVPYGTLERNRFILNEKSKACPSSGSTYEYQGHIGSEISNDDCTWTTGSGVVIDFGSSYYEFIGLTMTFDSIFGDKPSTIIVVAMSDSNPIYVETFDVTTNKNFVITDNIPSCNSMYLIPNGSTIPKRRFRLEELLFGIKAVYTENEITTSKFVRDVDLISSRIPKISFDFTLLDKDKIFDVENPTGIYSYMQSMQPYQFEYGYELDNGDIEWVNGGYTYSTGEVTVNSQGSIPEVTFKTISMLNYLTQIYKYGTYSSTPRTLYDLATEVLTYANIPQNLGSNRWILDNSLNSITTNVPIPKLSIGEILQLIANAGMCVLNVDRNGYITILPKSTTQYDFKYGLGDVYEPPKINKYPELKDIVSSYNVITVSPTNEELGTFDVSVATNTEFEFDFENATNITFSTSGTLSIIGTPSIYAGLCTITLNGTGSLTISGNKLITNSGDVKIAYGVTGETCHINNLFVTTKSHALSYGSWIGTYLRRRNEYAIADRGFVEVDTTDDVNLETSYSSSLQASVTYNEITYNGTMSGVTKLLIK